MLARSRGDRFEDITLAELQGVQDASLIAQQNQHLGFTYGHASQLLGDDIVRLVTVHNPDAPGTEPTWLKGPAPFNYVTAYIRRTLTEERDDHLWAITSPAH